MNVTHLNLRVRDVDACRAFYERHFGFRPAFDVADGCFVRNAAGFLLALTTPGRHEPLPAGFHLGFGVTTPEAVAEKRDELRAAGVTVSELEDHRPSSDYVSFRCWDPDGTEIEVLWEDE